MTRTDKKIRHLAIIPDGNRRWAKERGIFDEVKIYQKGTECIGNVVELVAQQEIEFFTLWASSLSNIRARSASFSEAMDFFYVKYFNKLAKNKTIKRKKVRIQVVGEWKNNLSKEAVLSIERAIDSTIDNSEKTLTLLIGYDGKRERGAAVLDLVRDVEAGLSLSPSIDSAEIELRKRSWTGSFLPDVDLLIRTGSWEDPHLSSGFLTFLIGDAQLSFPEVLWPDFSRDQLYEVLKSYNNRERRFGK